MQIDIIEAAGVIGALSVIIGLLFGLFRFIEGQKQNKKENEKTRRELQSVKKEQALICYSLAAALDGLHQLGANGNVTKASEKMSKYLNLAAHDENEGNI